MKITKRSHQKKLRYTAEIAGVGGRYAIQGNSRSLIFTPIESLYATSLTTREAAWYIISAMSVCRSPELLPIEVLHCGNMGDI